jgi:hypothetical protein
MSRYPAACNSRWASRLLIALVVILETAGAAIGGAKPRPAPDKAKAKGERHSVSASIRFPTNGGVGIQAEKVPGDFTVPEGFRAVDFTYSFYDPKTNYESTKLRPSNIYCVTKGRYLTEGDFAPAPVLPPGEYRFVVGGQTGAEGTLGYTLEPTGSKPDSDNKEKGTDTGPRADRVIEVVTWVPGKEVWKTPATYFVRGTKVTGQLDHTYEAVRSEHFLSEPQHNKGAFTGTIQGAVITGEWKIEILPNRIVITGTDGKSFDRLDWGSVTANTRTVLNADGTLTETQKGSGTTQWKWGPGAPDPGKQDSHQWNNAIPGEYYREPLQGTWKDRK